MWLAPAARRRGHRDHRHPGQQGPDHGHHGLEGGGGLDGHTGMPAMRGATAPAAAGQVLVERRPATVDGARPRRP